MAKTINPKEISQFQKDSQNWWDEEGPFSPLHALNPIRLRFIRDTLEKCGVADSNSPSKPFKKLKMMDVGCGGGLVCEPFARLGADVTGLDADDQAISVARAHATDAHLTINYQSQAVEDFHAKNKSTKFDVITALEIIEHVSEPDVFLDEIVACLKPGGVIIMSTLNRTIKSWALGIVAAEYILGWVAPGTHNWQQFIKPSTMARMMRERGFEPVAASGIAYHPIKREFTLAPHDLDVNYLMAFRHAV